MNGPQTSAHHTSVPAASAPRASTGQTSPRQAEAADASPSHRTAAVLAIGDEILLGQIIDTNSPWLGARLADLGVLVLERAAIGDDLGRMNETIRRLAAAVDLLIITGGLGPTADDLTRVAVAAATGDRLIEDADSVEQIRAWFAGRGRPMPEPNRVQALRPSRAAALPNHHGTAPGLAATFQESAHTCDIFCIPGPPAEMRPMFEDQVVPRLRKDPDRILLTRSLHCTGIGESDLAGLLGDLMSRDRNPLVGTNAGNGQVTCRLRYEGGGDPDSARRAIDDTEAAIRAVAGDYIFGRDEDTIAAVVLDMVRARRQSLGVVESCTGGLLGGAITAVSGSSDAFVGGLQTYTNQLKTTLARVPAQLVEQHGAVSAPCARAMAEGGAKVLGCDWCLSITGIAGPGGAVPARNGPAGETVEAKPVGTVYIALYGPDTADCRRFAMGGDREAVRRWSVQSALALLWLHLAGRGSLPLLRQRPVN